MKSLVTSRTVSAGPTGVSGPAEPSGAFQMPSTTGVVPVAVELHLEAGDLREPAGAAGEGRIAERREAVQERRRELGAGEREDHRPVAERQHGEHLAPGDLARLLAGAGRRRRRGLRAGRRSS